METVKRAQGVESYQKLVAENVADAKEISINFNSQPTVEVQGAQMADTRLSAFGYQIRLSAETHWLGGCIGRVVPHVGITVSRLYQSGTLANLHVAVWKTNGTVCGAVLASINDSNGFCWSMCSPTMKDIQDGIKNALIYVGIPAIIAIAMAVIIAPVAIALLPVGL